jgi:hypothetical protein
MSVGCAPKRIHPLPPNNWQKFAYLYTLSVSFASDIPGFLSSFPGNIGPMEPSSDYLRVEQE